MSRRIPLLASVLLALACPVSSHAASAFTSDTFIGAGSFTGLSYNSADSLILSATSNALQALSPAYTGVEAVSVIASYRGLPLDLSIPNGVNEVSLFINLLNGQHINQFFNSGGSRDENVRLALDFLQNSGLLSDIAQSLAANSSTDPIAGNPDSLMSTIVAADFEQAFLSDFSNIASPEAQAVDGAHLSQVGIGLEYGHMSPNGISVDSLTIPLSYSVRNDLDPRRQLLLRMPISIVDVDGAKAYHLGFGAAYRYPMNARWSLVPSVNYAFTAATDLGSTAQLASAGVTSTYYWRLDGYDVGIGNMLSYVTTMPFSYQGYDYDPGISNTVLRNGVVISVPTRVRGRKMHFETSLVDTRFFGSELFDDNYQELRFTLGTTRSSSSASTGLFRVGLALRHTPNDNGYKLEFGYWF